MVNVLFSAMIDVSMAILGVLYPTMLWEQFLCIGLGCVALAFGIVIELAPNVVVVPGEGVVRAIAKVSGVRVGTPAVTTRGMKEPEMVQIAKWIAKLAKEGDSAVEEVKLGVLDLCARFPLYPEV